MSEFTRRFIPTIPIIITEKFHKLFAEKTDFVKFCMRLETWLNPCVIGNNQ